MQPLIALSWPCHTPHVIRKERRQVERRIAETSAMFRRGAGHALNGAGATHRCKIAKYKKNCWKILWCREGGGERVTRLLITWHTLALDAIMHAAAAPSRPPTPGPLLVLSHLFPFPSATFCGHAIIRFVA